MKKRIIYIITLLLISMFAMQFVSRSHAKTYSVACLPAGNDKGGANENLSSYYHIGHSPSEDGHCYFRFPAENVMCISPRQAQLYQLQTGKQLKLIYSGSSGKECYFMHTDEYEKLIATLKQKPPVSRAQYNAPVVDSWQEVRDILLRDIPPVTKQ